MPDSLSRKRKDDEPPAAIAQRGWRYHHLGIPTDTPRPGERHIPHLGIWVSGFDTSPYGIEWMRFAPGCRVSQLVREVPHVAFEVDDLDAEISGKEILSDPASPSRNVRAAMIVHNGAPIELIEFQKCDSGRKPRRRRPVKRAS